MQIINATIPNVKIIAPSVFEDALGLLFESINQQLLTADAGAEDIFVQDNYCKSSNDVLRGLHYQPPPRAEGKVVRYVVDEVYDIAIDIRQGSPTFGKLGGINLSADNKQQLWIS